MGDLADNAEIEVERINAEALDRQKARQARIEESMRPRAPGAATDCDDCGAPIPAARLAALPHTGRCVECAEIAERYYREHAWKPQ